MIRNREARTTGSICIALLRHITFKVEVANEVHFPFSMEIITRPFTQEKENPLCSAGSMVNSPD
jgi:hypothetical protein